MFLMCSHVLLRFNKCPFFENVLFSKSDFLTKIFINYNKIYKNIIIILITQWMLKIKFLNCNKRLFF